MKDANVNGHNGTFTDWKLTLWGECIDPAKQSLLPMPTDQDDDDHDIIPAIVGTTSLTSIPSQTGLPSQPSDHIDRPVNAKPTSVISTTLSSTEVPSATAETSSITSATSTATSIPKPHSSLDTFLPSYFPTFGVSKRTQIWIYGAISVIILFCVALGIFFCVQRRRRSRTNRADYEFEMLDDHDANAPANGAPGGKRVKRRAGELYDAFAGESDEEIFSDAEAETEYKDEEPKQPQGAKPSKGLSEK